VLGRRLHRSADSLEERAMSSTT